MISAFVASYGYYAVFFGTLLEGETILIAAGFAAHRGLLHWPVVVLVAMAGATLGDQLAFFLGRWKGADLVERFPALARHRPRVHALLERYDILFILSVRFLYGMRIAGPVILGTSKVPALRFALLNVAGAAVWAVLISGAGYVFGAAVNTLIADLKRVEGLLLVAILVIGVLVFAWRRRHARMSDRQARD